MDALLIPTFFCPKAWAGMTGDDQTRFCNYCQKQVHNLDALSVEERVALLSSPAAKLCARYTVAIRRPRQAHKESYARHLMKYGAGVAVAGSAILVLWEMVETGGKPPFFRAVRPSWSEGGMPGHYYEEQQTILMGDMVMAHCPKSAPIATAEIETAPAVDVQLDPGQVEALLKQLKPAGPERIPYQK